MAEITLYSPFRKMDSDKYRIQIDQTLSRDGSFYIINHWQTQDSKVFSSNQLFALKWIIHAPSGQLPLGVVARKEKNYAE